MQNKRNNYRLSPLAEKDLEEIWLYSFTNWSLEKADEYHKNIVSAFEDLAQGTKIGSAVDVRENYQKYIIGSHIIFYHFSDSNLKIIRILHQQMDISRYLV